MSEAKIPEGAEAVATMTEPTFNGTIHDVWSMYEHANLIPDVRDRVALILAAQKDGRLPEIASKDQLGAWLEANMPDAGADFVDGLWIDHEIAVAAKLPPHPGAPHVALDLVFDLMRVSARIADRLPGDARSAVTRRQAMFTTCQALLRLVTLAHDVEENFVGHLLRDARRLLGITLEHLDAQIAARAFTAEPSPTPPPAPDTPPNTPPTVH